MYLTYADLRRKGVLYSKSQIRKLKAKGQFPQPVPGMARESVWLESEIDGWVAERIAAREAA